MAKSWLVFAVCIAVITIAQDHVDAADGDDDTSDTITFYFVRHGEGDRSDERMPLASRGLERAHRLARVLERAQLTHAFSSHTLRSIQAVEPAAKYHGLDVVELPPLGTEINGQIIHEVSPSDLAIGPLSEALSKVPVGSTVLVGVNADNVFAVMNHLGVPLATEDEPCELGRTCVPCLENTCVPREFDNLWILTLSGASHSPSLQWLKY